VNENFDLQAFQTDVERDLNRLLEAGQFNPLRDFDSSDFYPHMDIPEEHLLANLLAQPAYSDYRPKERLEQGTYSNPYIVAQEIVARRDIRIYLCPALQTVSNDAFDIAKVCTPILVGLVIAGTISIPLLPMLFAAIAFTISRAGVSSLCVGYPKKDDNKK
jgi:hypothetical protein